MDFTIIHYILYGTIGAVYWFTVRRISFKYPDIFYYVPYHVLPMYITLWPLLAFFQSIQFSFWFSERDCKKRKMTTPKDWY